MKQLLRLLFLFILPGSALLAQTPVKVDRKDQTFLIRGNNLSILKDADNSIELKEILDTPSAQKFELSEQAVPNLGVSPSAFWVKSKITNGLKGSLIIELGCPVLDYIDFYLVDENGKIVQHEASGERIPFAERTYDYPNFLFDLNIPKGKTYAVYFKVKSSEQIMMPLKVGSSRIILEDSHDIDVVLGIYIGLILVMLFYNLFIYFTVRDVSYLYYVFYIVIVGLTQTTLTGYNFEYLWPSNPWMANMGSFFFPSLVGIAAIMFLSNFLHTKEQVPKLHKGLYLFAGIYITCLLLAFGGFYNISYIAIQANAVLTSMYLIYVAVAILKLGYRPAKFFLMAWSFFLVGVCLYVMKDFGVFPYNNFTNYAMQIGSALEVVFLSFGLADKINILKQEKEQSQAKALEAVQENERIVLEQNVILETKVEERTMELAAANAEAHKALSDLKETQSQLVQSEKMASLGQLTAGIAHEINNPINFVSSNISPLKRDIDDVIEVFDKYTALEKETEEFPEKLAGIAKFKRDIDFDYTLDEIKQLIKGIEEGANRTSEIVKGLRVFSRLDENDLKKADLNECLDSTIAILKFNFGDRVEVVKDYAEIPEVECYPGKINQVFMNILNNSQQAIEEKGQIIIKTSLESDNMVRISLRDTGCGMPASVIEKIFDPFFTTKDVGVGTGLGLSIVIGIINDHKGTITVESEPGAGTEFIIKLPVSQTI